MRNSLIINMLLSASSILPQGKIKEKSLTFNLIQHKRLLLLFILLIGFKGHAQEFNDDAGLWLYFKFDKNITSKFNGQLIIQNRFDNNFSQYGQLNGNAEISYKLNKHFKILTGYVLGKTRRLDETYSNRHQAYAGFIFKKRSGRTVFLFRNLFQGQMVNIYTSKKGYIPFYYDRNKLTIKYEINKRWEIYVSEEINVPLFRQHGSYINRSRSYAGIQYNLTKRSYIEGYFLLQRKFGYKNMPERDFIYGLTYSHSF